MHKSVYARFEAPEVVLYDHLGRYRPINLKNHVDFAHCYDNVPRVAPECVPDDVESCYQARAGGE